MSNQRRKTDYGTEHRIGGALMKISIGDRVKVIDQEGIGYEITGTVVEDWGKTVVIIDDDAETLDDRLEFRISDLELIEEIS